MSSIARHHAEWLSLLEISGPFLSMSVLMDVFPHGLETDDTTQTGELRAAYEEWADNQGGLRPDPAIHTAWVRYVLQTALDMDADVLVEGQAIPDGIKAIIPEHGEVIRPDVMISPPPGEPALSAALSAALSLSKGLSKDLPKGTEGGQQPRLLIQIYPADQSLERSIPNRPWKASAATRMMELLRATGVRLGLVTNGERWMLVHAQRGETTTFVSWYAGLWLEERLTLRAFRTLLGARRFFGVPDGETLEAMLAASAQDQHEVTDQLGYQVRQAVEILIQAIDRADHDRGRTLLSGIGVDRLYEAALTVMMRLVFLLTAEERGLLLLGDPIYDQHCAVSTLRAQLREMADQQGEEVLERQFDAWCRLLVVFRAVYGGVQHENLRLPAYGGSLFDPDRFPFLEGRVPDTDWRTTPADPLPINNRTVMHLLEALQMLQVQVPGSANIAEARRLSFRALDIEQIGHVYEGLLDHVAVRATAPVLGLVGTKYKEPEIPLSELESRQAQGQAALVKFLREQTGRSAGALKKAAEAQLATAQLTTSDALRAGRLRASCGNDEALYRRVLSFAGLVRDDDYGFPAVIPAGSVYVTEGPTRRATGTHYTPRSLTEPIVQHTLEPLVYAGPAEGKPREAWQLRPPAELLDLKICDMAMGSGAFLVQSCRYLSERLVEAWEQVQANLQITPEGRPATGDPAETIIPQDGEERLTLARRLVVDRCLYGVDKNPLAVEMAKLSLWLLTLDKGQPFTFLDHALKCGDSLVGVDLDQLTCWNLEGNGERKFETVSIRADVENMVALRREIATTPVRDTRDQAHKAYLLAQAEALAHDLRRGGDMLIASYYNTLSESERQRLGDALLHAHRDGADVPEEWAEVADLGELRPFHWPLEFPEVFLDEHSGFDAFMGNPPFLGGSRISTIHGDKYYQYLKAAYPSIGGQTDLCAIFFLRAFEYSRLEGVFGLIATKTISQGDTREAGLEYLANKGASIYRADSARSWPGSATVVVSIVHTFKGRFRGQRMLDQNPVSTISSFLKDTLVLRKPFVLDRNAGKSFSGTKVYGLGFVLEPEEAQGLIDRNRANSDVLFLYLGGKDLNSRPSQSPSRWVINFFDWPIEKAQDYPECFAIILEKVKPERQKLKSKSAREKWWQFERRRPELYEAIEGLDRVLAISQATKFVQFSFVPSTNVVFDQALVIIADDSFETFVIVNSSVHSSWAEHYRSSLGKTTYYIPTKAFQPFPMPTASPEQLNTMCYSGEAYHDHRCQAMLERQEGLTDIYNRFHDPDEAAADIVRLRELHVEMDQAVAAAYGWDDLALDHGFHETPQGLRFTISQEARWEVLDRLLALNHERYAEEVAAGLHEKKKGKGSKRKKAAKKKDERQMSLL